MRNRRDERSASDVVFPSGSQEDRPKLLPSDGRNVDPQGTGLSQSKRKYVGYVDLGAGDVDDTRRATNTLVFMAVGLKGVWRHPVAYFLTDRVPSETQAELARTVLCSMSDVGLKVRALVADGLQANLAMFSQLGAGNLRPKDFQLPVEEGFFLHPATGEKVHILLDVAHMLKLSSATFWVNMVAFNWMVKRSRGSTSRQVSINGNLIN